MTKVVVQDGNVEVALKKFSVKVARSGVPSELKKRKHYEKPGVKRRNELKEMINVDAVNDFRRRALNPDHPVTRGSAENPDIYYYLIEKEE